MPVINPVAPAAVISPDEGPCSWTIDTACCPDWETLPPAAQSNGIAWATYILWALTGRRYGPCSVTVRPCGPKCQGFGGYMTWPVGSPGLSGAGGPWMTPFIDNGIWRNCVCAGGCSCEAACQVLLQGPVAVVDEVMVDGLILDPSAYRLDNGVILVRTDGECWPDCQDMSLANDAVGAFAVTYQRGTAVPRAGQIAAGELACEFAKACAGNGECQLPGQLASLSRNGVDVQMVDPSTFLDDGLTGLPNVDLWIRAVNPRRLASRPRVRSGDVRTPRFVT